jgi:hypothetical protein
VEANNMPGLFSARIFNVLGDYRISGSKIMDIALLRQEIFIAAASGDTSSPVFYAPMVK